MVPCPCLLLLLLAPLRRAIAGSPPGNWRHGLAGTHFWDCNGGGCDATVVRGDSWSTSPNPLYVYAPVYAPLNPVDYGGASYGEQLWMTGAVSDTLSDLMGTEDDTCCGQDSAQPGGCGKCLLVRNPAAVNSDWTAVVMKKNRCPPHSHGCETGNVHMDLAVPGYDNLQFSTANVCGDISSTSYMSKAQSETCGSWYSAGSSTIAGCDCSALSASTDAERIIKRGCELFTAWGWTGGNPTLEYQPVACPAAFRTLIGDAFTSEGVAAASYPANPQPICQPWNSCSGGGGGGPTPPPAPDPGPGQAHHCDCSWTGVALANCGQADGSHCWNVCCVVPNTAFAAPPNCDCSWTGTNSAHCGVDDGSVCWTACCSIGMTENDGPPRSTSKVIVSSTSDASTPLHTTSKNMVAWSTSTSSTSTTTTFVSTSSTLAMLSETSKLRATNATESPAAPTETHVHSTTAPFDFTRSITSTTRLGEATAFLTAYSNVIIPASSNEGDDSMVESDNVNITAMAAAIAAAFVCGCLLGGGATFVLSFKAHPPVDDSLGSEAGANAATPRNLESVPGASAVSRPPGHFSGPVLATSKGSGSLPSSVVVTAAPRSASTGPYYSGEAYKKAQMMPDGTLLV